MTPAQLAEAKALCEEPFPPDHWAGAKQLKAFRSITPQLIAEVSALTARRDELLATIARLSNELPFPDEVKGWTEQRAKLLAEIGTLKAERDEWRRRYDNAPAQEAYEAVRAELTELQESDSTAAQRYEADIDDNLPRYSIGEDCHGEPDEANYHERIEYAGEEIRELRRELSAIRSALDDWDWAGLLRDAERGDFDSVVDALRTVVRVAGKERRNG